MADQQQQQSEEFQLYGILPEHQARGTIKYEDYRSIVQDNLELGPIYTLSIDILVQEYQIQILEKVKLDIQTIYKSFQTLTFLKSVPPFLNNRTTDQNIKIIKAAIHLYSKQLIAIYDIKHAALVFQLKELELLTEGLPCDTNIINQLLWKFNKTISHKVLDLWIKMSQPFLEVKGSIQAYEFLFLVANTLDRTQYFNKIPKSIMDISRDQRFRLFNVDSSGLKTLKNPDTKIQHYMNYQFNVDKAQFQGRSLQDRNEYYAHKRQQKFDQFMKQKNSAANDFKKILKEPELYIEIKTKLKNAQQLLNHSKLNGKMLRAQLLQDFQLEEKSLKPPSQPETQPLQQSRIQQLKAQPQYAKLQAKRPLSAAIKNIQKEVIQYQEEYFVTELAQKTIGRTTSAVSMATTMMFKPEKRFQSAATLAVIDGKKITRPITAITTKQYSNMQMNQTNKNFESILDDELASYEHIQEDQSSKIDEKFVFYGSANSAKLDVSIKGNSMAKSIAMLTSPKSEDQQRRQFRVTGQKSINQFRPKQNNFVIDRQGSQKILHSQVVENRPKIKSMSTSPEKQYRVRRAPKMAQNKSEFQQNIVLKQVNTTQSDNDSIDEDTQVDQVDQFEAEELDQSFEKSTNLSMSVGCGPMVWNSVYPNRRPTIFFQYPSTCEKQRSMRNARPINEEESKRLNLSYKISGQVPYKCVVSAFEAAGFHRWDDDEEDDWNIFWGIGNSGTQKQMNKHQKINHFPGCWNIGRKDNLWINLSKMKRKHPIEYNFIPNTYLLAYDYDRFIAQREMAPKGKLWIMKPCAAARGNGIKMISKKSKVNKRKNYLIMEYIQRPHLINGLKYDLRVYVLISSFDPLRVYMYDDGLVRFATEQYSVSHKDLSKKYIHLTNFSVNKKSPNFIKNQQTQNDDYGSKWSHQALRRKYEELGLNSKDIFSKIQDVIVKTCIACEPFMLNQNARCK